MIYLYSGTPGSGKSYHAVKDIRDKLLRRDKNGVIANFPFVQLRRQRGRFDYVDNADLTIALLMEYARKYHRLGVEGQTLLVIDEAQCIFNTRDWNGKGIVRGSQGRSDSRMDWIQFFSQHRKLGFNVILIAQNDKMLDKQIRSMVEYNIKHLKMTNAMPFMPTAFLAVEKWYGQNMKLGSQIILYRKRIAKLYDSYAMFDKMAEAVGAADGEAAATSEVVPIPASERRAAAPRPASVPARANRRRCKARRPRQRRSKPVRRGWLRGLLAAFAGLLRGRGGWRLRSRRGHRA